MSRQNQLNVTDARILSIIRVFDPVFEALVAVRYGALFPVDAQKKQVSFEDALHAWNCEPRALSTKREKKKKKSNENNGSANQSMAADDGDDAMVGEIEEERPDIESVLSEVLQQDAVQFNASKLDMYKRHQMALSINAQVLVGYRENGVQKRAIVLARWPTFSAMVPLRIVGRVMPTQRDEQNVAERLGVINVDASGAHAGVWIDEIDFVGAKTFYTLLIENGNVNHAEALEYAKRVYSAPVEQGENHIWLDREHEDDDDDNDQDHDSGQPAVFGAAQLLDAHESLSARDARRAAQLAQARQNQTLGSQQLESPPYSSVAFHPESLRLRCERLFGQVRKFDDAPHVALALRATLYNQQLRTIADAYGEAIALSALARGPKFMRALERQLTTAPHTLCVDQLRRRAAAELREPALELLPDLSFDAYCKLVDEYPDNENCAHRVGIDIYHNLFRRDVYGYFSFRDAMSTDRKRVYTSGHMFSVLGAHASFYKDRYYHWSSAQMAGADPDSLSMSLFDDNSLSECGRFCLPWHDLDEVIDDEGFRRYAQQLPSQVIGALKVDFERLKHRESKTVPGLLRGLHWLTRERVVVVHRFIGTGRFNDGMPVDAFTIAHIDEMQRELAQLLADITDRGARKQAQIAACGDDDQRQKALGDVYRRYENERKQWLKDYNSALYQLNNFDARSKEKPAPPAASSSSSTHQQAPEESADAQARDKVRGESMHALAVRIMAAEETLGALYEHNVEQHWPTHNDPYGDIRQRRLPSYDEAVCRDDWRTLFRSYVAKPYCCWPLLRIAPLRTSLNHSTPFAAEQVHAVRRVSQSAISQISGRAGVGKTEILSAVVEQYPPEQVLLLAFTGQVASNLQRRTGLPARTVHSALLAHSRWKEAASRARRFRLQRTYQLRKRRGKLGSQFASREDLKNAFHEDVDELRSYVEQHLGAQPPFESPFRGVRVLCIDEVSLLPFLLFYRLIQAAHAPHEGRFLEKLILIGDVDQLPSIEYGSLQSDFAHGLPQCVVQLTQNHRSSGTELFALAEAMAAHDEQLPMPPFADESAWSALEERRGDIVCLNNDEQWHFCKIEELEDKYSAFTRMLRRIYTSLDAHEIDKLSAHRVQCIAHTNVLVDAANRVLGRMYFAEPLEHAIMVGDSTGAVQTVQNAVAQRNIMQERQQRAKQVVDMFMKTFAYRLPIGGKFMVLNNHVIKFDKHKHDDQRREKRLYNGRILTACHVYLAPKRLSANVPCRCALCGPEDYGVDEDGDKIVPSCMTRYDLVPAKRRFGVPGRVPPLHRNEVLLRHPGAYDAARNDHHKSKFNQVDRNSRQMLVARDQHGDYVELDVAQLLDKASSWKHAYAVTLHKLQGGEEQTIVYLATEGRQITWKYLYTAITRARKRCVIVSNDRAFRTMAHRREALRRSAFWLYMRHAVAQREASEEQIELPQWPTPVCGDADETKTLWSIFEHMRTRQADENAGDKRKRSANDTAAASDSETESDEDSAVDSDELME